LPEIHAGFVDRWRCALEYRVTRQGTEWFITLSMLSERDRAMLRNLAKSREMNPGQRRFEPAMYAT